MIRSEDEMTDLTSHHAHAGALSAEYSRLGHLQSGHSLTLALALAKQSDYRHYISELTPGKGGTREVINQLLASPSQN